MPIYSGFFNSVNGDRKYDATWFADYFASFIGNGVFPNPSTGLQVVESTNLKTVVKAGKGWINGYYVINDGDYTLQHDIADGVLKRIDRVVMRLNFLTRQIELLIKKGAYASTPVAPVLQRNADAYELALADVLINNGATVITQARITDQRLNSALCGIVHGVVDQVDTTTIFNQYQAWFGEFTEEKQVDFDAWIESLQDILSGDVAGNLATRITSVESALATHKADYVSHPANGGTSAGTATAYTCNSSPNPSSLVDKIGIVITAHVDSGANPTLKWGSLAAKSIRKSNGSAASFKKDGLYTLRYNSVNDSFILQGEGGEYGDVASNDVRNTKTFGTENGVMQGTLNLEKLISSNIKRDIVIDGIQGTLAPASGDAEYVGVVSRGGNALSRLELSNGELVDVGDTSTKGGPITATYYNKAGTVLRTVGYPIVANAYNRVLGYDDDGVYIYHSPAGTAKNYNGYEQNGSIKMYNHSGTFVKSFFMIPVGSSQGQISGSIDQIQYISKDIIMFWTGNAEPYGSTGYRRNLYMYDNLGSYRGAWYPSYLAPSVFPLQIYSFGKAFFMLTDLSWTFKRKMPTGGIVTDGDTVYASQTMQLGSLYALNTIIKSFGWR